MNALSMRQSGQSSWAIAQRFYGDGKLEVRLFEANGVRAHPDARGLTHPGVNYPGWVCACPNRHATRKGRRRSEENDDDGMQTERLDRTFTGAASIAESEEIRSMNWLEAWSITTLAELLPRLEAALHHRQRGDIITQQAISIGVAVVVVGAVLVAFYKIVGTVLDNYGAQPNNVGH